MNPDAGAAPSRRPTRRAPAYQAHSHSTVGSGHDAHVVVQFEKLMDSAPVAAFVKDARGRYLYANPFMLATMGRNTGSGWRGKTDADMWPPEAAAMMREHDEMTLHGGGSQVFSHVMPLEDGLHTVLLMEFPMPIGDVRLGVGGIGVGGLVVDVTQHSKSDADRDRLAAVIEQSSESVMMVDLGGRITYVNRAFERVTGYSRAEALGQNPRLIGSGIQRPWFYDAMWATIASGLRWAGDLVNRRKDGTLFTEEAVISPIRDASGAVTSYVAVKRDVTEERALSERSTLFARERALIGETIRGMRAGDTPEITAQAICRRIVSLTGLSSASLAVFGLDGRAIPIGYVVAGEQDPPLRPITYQRSQYLRDRAAKGPFIEPWVDQPSHPYNQLLNRLAIHTIAYAPVRHGDRLIGLLLAHSEAQSSGTAVPEMLPALVEFADLAGVLIGDDVVKRAHLGRTTDRLSAIILDQGFKPVFQPVVDLASRSTVGYEALTRFKDGANPEAMFAEAAAAGLGLELEIATLRAAFLAAESLPEAAWLNLNASPELIMAGEPLISLLSGCPRRLVLEVTEHTPVADYPAFRAAMAALGPNVELAVDDAGAGFASLRHILELRPAFVKLDRWLVTGLEADEARQAMVAGLLHFALSTGCRLIAEGIETESELATLQTLDVQMGQGYLLGRPLPVAECVPPPVSKSVDAAVQPSRADPVSPAHVAPRPQPRTAVSIATPRAIATTPERWPTDSLSRKRKNAATAPTAAN
jgi:PAS domain S-box-containing protein